MVRDSNFGTSQRYFSRLCLVFASIRKLRASYGADPSFDKDPMITLFHSVCLGDLISNSRPLVLC